MDEIAKTHIFLVGSKGIPAQYGGFETFVEKLTAGKKSEKIQYHVSCMDNHEISFLHNGAECFNVKLPCKGALGRILHVSRALRLTELWKKKNKKENAIVYMLGCRIGPLLIWHYRNLHRMGVKVYVNPDGLEWKRDKWNWIEKKFLKFCEKCLVLNSDLAICDSKNIEQYILKTYPSMEGKTTYIAYGADIKRSESTEAELQKWYRKNKISKQNYYLVVGRFVPENNYEIMISEFMKSKTKKSLVIISNVEQNTFFANLQSRTQFKKDSRVCFAGTIYNQELLKKIREEAFAYIHGHEVGGTNPSLLEALASTKLNLLLDVGFNREVAGDSALYWNKENGSLANLIDKAEKFPLELIYQKDTMSLERIKKFYSWNSICDAYESLWKMS